MCDCEYEYLDLQIGQSAPEFTAQAYLASDQFADISLEDYRGKWTVLFFYPLDFTFVCPTEIKEFSRRNAEFMEINAQVLGVSVDSVYSHQAWCKGSLGPVNFPLLSDLTREISSAYQVLIPEKGMALRGTFIIDPEGILRFMLVHDNSIGRSVDETLRVLKALQTGELCPASWHPGDSTLGK